MKYTVLLGNFDNMYVIAKHSAPRELLAIHNIGIHSALREWQTINYKEIHSALKELQTIHYIEIHSAPSGDYQQVRITLKYIALGEL